MTDDVVKLPACFACGCAVEQTFIPEGIVCTVCRRWAPKVEAHAIFVPECDTWIRDSAAPVRGIVRAVEPGRVAKHRAAAVCDRARFDAERALALLRGSEQSADDARLVGMLEQTITELRDVAHWLRSAT